METLVYIGTILVVIISDEVFVVLNCLSEELNCTCLDI